MAERYDKLPFRLQFDEFEDAVPAVANQRFSGFRELSFSPGFSDPSLIRDKLASDMFRLAGVNAAQSAFYRVIINFGAGAKYCGVYTVVEVIDDTMIEDQFGEDNGNIYKPESNLTAFIQSQLEKKNNETAADCTDVQSFITALNSATRTTNATAWRSALESAMDMEHFLKRLAGNNAIVNWDTYGSIAHNYYVYSRPTRKLVWIPWDHNESMLSSPGITSATGSGGQAGRQGVSLSMNEVATTWPLLRYVAADPVYLASYRNHLQTFSNAVLATGAATDMIDRYTALIAPHVTGAGGEQSGYTQLTSQAAFTTAANTLRTHLAARRALIAQYRLRGSDEEEAGQTLLRTRLRVKRALAPRVDVYASSEPYFAFGEEYPVDNWRNTLGLTFGYGGGRTADLYYIYRPDYAKSYNRTFHVVGVTLGFDAKIGGKKVRAPKD